VEPHDQVYPHVSGDYIVWQDGRDATGVDYNWDIYMYDLSTSTEIPFRTGSYIEGGAVISGNYIVWQDERNDVVPDLYMYNVLTLTEIPISTAPG